MLDVRSITLEHTRINPGLLSSLEAFLFLGVFFGSFWRVLVSWFELPGRGAMVQYCVSILVSRRRCFNTMALAVRCRWNRWLYRCKVPSMLGTKGLVSWKSSSSQKVPQFLTRFMTYCEQPTHHEWDNLYFTHFRICHYKVSIGKWNQQCVMFTQPQSLLPMKRIWIHTLHGMPAFNILSRLLLISSAVSKSWVFKHGFGEDS